MTQQRIDELEQQLDALLDDWTDEEIAEFYNRHQPTKRQQPLAPMTAVELDAVLEELISG